MATDIDSRTGSASGNQSGEHGEKHALSGNDTAFPLVVRVFLEYIEAVSQPADAVNRMQREKAEAALRALDDDTLSAFALPPCSKPDEALTIARALVRLMPERAATHFALGLALHVTGRYAEAIAPYRHAFALNPRLPGLRNTLASALLNTGAQHQGNAARDEIIQLYCDAIIEGHGNTWDTLMWNALVADNLRLIRPDARDFQHITAIFRRALESDPHNPATLGNYSILLRECPQWGEAERTARLACQYAPDDRLLRANLGTLLLLRGNFAEGLYACEQRWDGLLIHQRPHFTQPRWHGEPLAGRTLLLWGEQGKGDVLLGSRYVPLLAERVHREGGRLVWCMFSSLADLLKRNFHGHYDAFFVGDASDASDARIPPPRLASTMFYRPDASVGSPVEALPQHDLEVSLLSLPLLFGTRENTIPGSTRYLSSEPAAAMRWRKRLAGEKRLKVGLAWMGNPQNSRNAFRSVRLADYARHFAALGKDVAFYSLQPNTGDEIVAARATGFEITDDSAEWKTFDDTAAFIDALDLVITVCTSIAHLAGALGQRSWVLLDVNPYWVWQLERRDNPWYPNTTLYRQKEAWQWEPVLEAVMADLKALAQKRHIP